MQTINLQYIEGSKWREKAEQLTMAYRNIEAVRGDIYASDGSLLATSIPIYEIRFDANTDALTDKIFNDNVDSLAYLLSQVFSGKSHRQYKSELIAARKKKARYHLIKRNVKYTELKEVKHFPIFRRGKYKGGFIYTQKNRREKPFKVLASRTIGYQREGNNVGLEAAYGKELTGIEGKRWEQKIAGGVWKPISDENKIEPIDGSDIYTTIDINIQDVAENALLKQLVEQEADHGCVALMEVSTGEVKAIANLKRNKNGTYSERYNYVIGESTEPGSVFKLAALMVAFEGGYLDLDDMVDTENGTTKFYDRTMYDSHVGGYGKITVKRAFEVSSNVAVSKLINRIYSKKSQEFIDRLYSMNLNQRLGVEIPGEGSPLIKSTNDPTWSGVTLPWMSIGYETQMTPLQILTFYNTVANDGKMVKPKFVKEIKQRGKLISEYKTETINNAICSKETIRKAKIMLEGVVENGTAVNLKNSVYKIAGKTGTAQIANDKYGYYSETGKSYQASFVGYFPADNPKYTCIVVVNAPSKNVYYGNLVAGPIFKEVADKVYATSIEIHHEIDKKENVAKSRIPYAKDGYYNDLTTIYNEFEIEKNTIEGSPDWASVSTGDKSVQMSEKKIMSAYVPDVTGMSIRDAVYILENRGMIVKFSGQGEVKKQSIAPKSLIKKGLKIILELA